MLQNKTKIEGITYPMFQERYNTGTGKRVSGSPPLFHMPTSSSVFLPGHDGTPLMEGKMAAILQLSQYCTFRMDSISTVITEPGQPVSHAVGQHHPFWVVARLPPKAPHGVKN